MKIETMNKLFSGLEFEQIAKFSLMSSDMITYYVYWKVEELKLKSEEDEKLSQEKYVEARDKLDQFIEEIYKKNKDKL